MILILYYLNPLLIISMAELVFLSVYALARVAVHSLHEVRSPRMEWPAPQTKASLHSTAGSPSSNTYQATASAAVELAAAADARRKVCVTEYALRRLSRSWVRLILVLCVSIRSGLTPASHSRSENA